MNIGEWIQRQSKVKIYVLATSLFVLDESIDYLSGPELNVSFFHLLPIFLIVWNAGFLPGLIYSLFCTLVVLFVTIHPLFSTPTLIQASNAIANFVFYMAFIAVLNQLKKYLEKMAFMAEVDGLTGLLNPRSFLQRADRIAVASTKNGNPFTIMYIDVDNFKKVNDTLGHSAGDDVLRSIGGILNSHFRKNDLRTRIGGDEFAVLLPGFSMEEAKKEIPKFHEILNHVLGKNKGATTCSIGAVTFLQVPPSAKDALIEADMLMYQVKMSGKNSFKWKTVPSQGPDIQMKESAEEPM